MARSGGVPTRGFPADAPARGAPRTAVGTAASSPLRLTAAAAAMLAVVVLLVVALLAAIALAGAESRTAAITSHVAQLTASGLATTSLGVLAWRRTWHRVRRPAALLAVGCGLWFAGQLSWFVSETVGPPLPDVSFADALYLGFPIFMATAVLVPLRRTRLRQLRVVLDGVIIAASLFVISWVLALTHVTSEENRPDDALVLIVSLCYPCLDIVAITMLLLGISRMPVNRVILGTLVVAMTLIATGDTLYAYETVVSSFQVGTAVDLCWLVGFGVIAVFASIAWTVDIRTVPAPTSETPEEWESSQSRVLSMLPYLPVMAALCILAVRNVVGSSDPVSELVTIVVLGLVLLRQYLTLRDNRNLTADLAARERQLRQQAFHDVLTGLPNRALFTQRVVEAVERHRRERRPLALLFIDLDDFKTVNDTLGHPVGDELVSRVGARLRRLVRSTDTVSRFGGDEFAVLVEGDHDSLAMADRLVGELRRPFALRVQPLAISCSIGIAHVAADADTPGVDELFSRADIAMYAAKRAGKGQRSAHHPAMVLPEADDLHFRPLLIDDLAAGRIHCLFQPIVALDTRQLVSLEALARWHVDGRQVDQGYFIALAGRSGLLPALTEHMLDLVAAHLAAWNEQFDCADLKVSLNVPPGLMADLSFPARVVAVLEQYEVDPRQLALEITEDALLGDYRTTQVVAQRFRELGIQVWLDDFGSGYSSLLSLRRIALHSVKIDLEFVANIHRDAEAEEFLGAMLRMTRELGLVTTAEGVELAEQADILTALGCTYAQGFLFSEPIPAPAVEAMLRRGYGRRPLTVPPVVAARPALAAEVVERETPAVPTGAVDDAPDSCAVAPVGR